MSNKVPFLSINEVFLVFLSGPVAGEDGCICQFVSFVYSEVSFVC